MSSMLSAHDVARILRTHFPDLGSAKLHRLLYYAQGWHLAIMGSALFAEDIEAWANGPVVASLWADEKYGRLRPPEREPSQSQLAAIDYVIDRYGRFTGRELIRRTHQEDPWRLVSEADDDGTQRSPAIPHDVLRAWFEGDDEYLSYRADVDQLRTRAHIYSFEIRALPENLEEVSPG